MPEYRVRWEIDVSADTPYEAALAARAFQVKSNTTASVFQVMPADGSHPPRDVDLNPQDDDRLSWYVEVRYRTTTGVKTLSVPDVIARNTEDALEAAAAWVRKRRKVARIDGCRVLGRPIPAEPAGASRSGTSVAA